MATVDKERLLEKISTLDSATLDQVLNGCQMVIDGGEWKRIPGKMLIINRALEGRKDVSSHSLRAFL
jgi:hypothetical protein